ncbi:MAG TPA: hypothetical protein VGN27_01355 [Gaiellaceae bacterium]|jgi:hypothetical protein|nr:hypothetical protein [Gaiellaceae bacterium]
MVLGLSVVLAVLALAGAPASTTVLCNPSLPPRGLEGEALPSVIHIAPGGAITPGPLDTIVIGPTACAGLLYAAATPSERAAIRRLNPGLDESVLVGAGLQVALHEANHVALDSTDECAVEKATRSEVNSLIVRYADPGRSRAAETQATASDASLPPQYHGC